MPVNRATGIPLYRQIEQHIREKIDSGTWEAGYQIPTEQMLCEEFQVSRITVVRALNRLVSEGLIRKEQGRGTFVENSVMMPEPLTLRSFSEEMEQRGLRNGMVILHHDVEVPTPRVREMLKMSSHEKVWRISRLLTADETPVGIQHAHLPCAHFPNLGAHINDNVSLYQMLQRVYRVVPDTAVETYCSVPLHDEECALLSMPKQSPAFAVERLTFTDEKPIEFVRSVMRSDYFQYTVRLTRQHGH